MSKTVKEINQKILDKTVRVVTAAEMPAIVEELGAEGAAAAVDVVTTGTFGAMCSSGVWLNFGHSEPPIKMTRVWLNDVEAYAGVAAVDAYLGVTQASETLGMNYAGAHVIEDLLLGRPVVLRAVSYGTDCYPRKEILTEITLADLNQAIMCNPRNAYQRYNAAGNSSARILHTYMGKLLPGCANVNFSGAGELSPLMNDPNLEIVGIGTRIFLGGGIGYITGSGTQHNPGAQFATLMVQGDLKQMTVEFLRAAFFYGYGSSLYVGIGIPIPVLNSAIANKTGIRDRDIETDVMDYSVPSRSRPVLGRFNYEQLKSGTVRIGGREIPTSPLVSYSKSGQVALTLKQWIEGGSFLLSEPVAKIPAQGSAEPLALKPPAQRPDLVYRRRPTVLSRPASPLIAWDGELCFSCGQCLAICPMKVFSRNAKWLVNADTEKCTGCGRCDRLCPVGAIGGGQNGR
ncbi:MAG: 4Fe-4S dicluster domain-containing protein [Chrysiogenales bacterium]|nr:MAG: 4Fe-4S dicluster domain-containing protein [Chrysiogenales bacterium]